MEIKVNGKARELKFNMGFIRRLDEIYFFESDGLSFSAGLMKGYPSLQMGSPTDLANFVRCAMGDNISQAQVERALDDYAEENDGLDDLFDYVISELGKSPVTKSTVNKLTNQIEKAENN